MILQDRKSHIPWGIFKPSINELVNSAKKLDSEKIRVILEQIIPTYRPRTFGPHIQSSDNIPRTSIKAEA